MAQIDSASCHPTADVQESLSRMTAQIEYLRNPYLNPKSMQHNGL